MSTYEISKSSLLSLKAEILRKQQELVKAKADNDVKIKLIKKSTPLEIKNKRIEARQTRDLEEVDEDILKQSRSMLEAKSKLYDKLSSGNLSQEEKERKARFLVHFDRKNRHNKTEHDLPPHDSEDEPDKYPQSDDDPYQSDDDANKNPDEKWVDYIDCLGRSRKCLQKDLAYIKSKDEDLKKSVEIKNKSKQLDEEVISDKEENANETVNDDETKKEISQESELLSSDMRRELLRQQWEKEEDELQKKSNIHYQDILFGEARTHGVGYYGFSKDEEERAKQQEALKKLRLETEEKQKKAQELKAMREKQLAARIKAAKDRRRARLGLPPEEEPAPAPKDEISEEEKKIHEDLKRKEEEKERMLEEARKGYIRPWDIGKEGVKEHYEMSQEEWVEKKRNERPDEFAPPTLYRKEFRSTIRNHEIEDTDKSLKFTTKKTSKKKPQHKKHLNPYKPDVSIPTLYESQEGENISKECEYKYNRSNFNETETISMQPVPIENLCAEESEFDDRMSSFNKTMQNLNKHVHSEASDSNSEIRGRGVEIAPPPSFEYYGPSHSKRPRIPQEVNNIEDSIEEGLKFLRKQVEEKEKSTKHPREMFLY